VCRLCKDFRGDWTNLEDVKKFVLYYFLSARRNSSKPLYHHFTVAIDTNNIRIVFKVSRICLGRDSLQSMCFQLSGMYNSRCWEMRHLQ